MQKETISARIKKGPKTPYQVCAAKYKTGYVYVAQIASGKRVPTRGKGLEIKKWLENYINEQN
jgi:hypothetical protein